MSLDVINRELKEKARGIILAQIMPSLRRTGRNLTTESFIKAMEDAGEISFGRFNVKYTPKSRNGSTYVELAIVDAEGSLRY